MVAAPGRYVSIPYRVALAAVGTIIAGAGALVAPSFYRSATAPPAPQRDSAQVRVLTKAEMERMGLQSQFAPSHKFVRGLVADLYGDGNHEAVIETSNCTDENLWDNCGSAITVFAKDGSKYKVVDSRMYEGIFEIARLEPIHFVSDKSYDMLVVGKTDFFLSDGGSPITLVNVVSYNPAAPPAQVTRLNVTGTGSCLNIRQAYHAESKSLACLPDGSELEYDGRASHWIERASDRNAWTPVRDRGRGIEGYAATRYLNVRQEPDNSPRRDVLRWAGFLENHGVIETITEGGRTDLLLAKLESPDRLGDHELRRPARYSFQNGAVVQKDVPREWLMNYVTARYMYITRSVAERLRGEFMQALERDFGRPIVQEAMTRATAYRAASDTVKRIAQSRTTPEQKTADFDAARQRYGDDALAYAMASLSSTSQTTDPAKLYALANRQDIKPEEVAARAAALGYAGEPRSIKDLEYLAVTIFLKNLSAELASSSSTAPSSGSASTQSSGFLVDHGNGRYAVMEPGGNQSRCCYENKTEAEAGLRSLQAQQAAETRQRAEDAARVVNGRVTIDFSNSRPPPVDPLSRELERAVSRDPLAQGVGRAGGALEQGMNDIGKAASNILQGLSQPSQSSNKR